MDNIGLNKLWKSQDEKLNQLISINHQIMKDLTLSKSSKVLNKARPVKWLGIAVGIPWIVFLNFLVFAGWSTGAVFLMISAGLISVLTTIALGTYIYHLILIHRANYADSVAVVQENIVKLKTSSISILRILVLQIPFWQTMFINTSLVMKPDWTYLIINVLLIVIFSCLALWLYVNIKIENLNKKWLKWLFTDIEWNAILQANEVLKQFDELRK